MKMKKQIFLPILLSLSVFFSSAVLAPAATYASVMPQVRVVRELAAEAPNNTQVPEVDRGGAGQRGSARADEDDSFFGRVLEKLAVMFLVYMFLEAIHAIINDFFHDGESNFKIKVTPGEKQDGPQQKAPNQNKNMKRIPAQDV